MEIMDVGESDGIFDKIPKRIGKGVVCLHAKTANHQRFDKGILTLDRADRNYRAHKYEIAKISEDSAERTGLKVGDVVMVDMLARFRDTFPISFIRDENILLRTSWTDNLPIALKNHVIVKIVEPKQKELSCGLLTTSNITPYGIVFSLSPEAEKAGLHVGDKVVLTTDADCYYIDDTKYFDYKLEKIVGIWISQNIK
jgi:hypothetical protein